jgi:hypothetical protein
MRNLSLLKASNLTSFLNLKEESIAMALLALISSLSFEIINTPDYDCITYAF